MTVRLAAMQNLWFITNRASGSTSEAKCAALEAVFEERGLSLVGRTRFPEEGLPTLEVLDDRHADTVVLFAGDGTINAALCRLASWQGAFLILPGGTMNMLAKTLHASPDPAEIIHFAHMSHRRVALPYVEAGAHRAFVGLILGPAASWFRPRELVRQGRLARVGAAITHAWRRTFRDKVRVAGVEGLRDACQAVFIEPKSDHLDVGAIDASEWRSIIELGWNWLTGDWLEARAVTHRRARTLRLLGRKRVLGLFDGEPVMLDAGKIISGGMTDANFISTRDQP